ncbi:MAG TPA: MlaD family protein [Bryobacteraceae bacterium]|nr:MlaD family protein [Bryobacteraceae bacterium]
MTNEAKVGLFVISGVVVLGAAIYFVRTTQTIKGQVPHKTYLRYAGGLAPGATVLFGGIKVGQVTAVRPDSEDPTRIEIGFEVRKGTPLNENSIARVGTVSIMSNPALAISTGSNDARRLSAGEGVRSEEAVSIDEITRRVATVADSANAMLLQLRKDIPAITQETQTLLANLNQVAGTGNQRKIENILAELNTLVSRESPKIARITDQISALATRADSTVASIEPVLANVNRTVTNVNATVDTVRDPLARDLAELERTIVQARKLITDVDSVVRTNESDIGETVRNLHVTSDNLRTLTESVKRQPWSLIRIKQGPDRKVPQ